MADPGETTGGAGRGTSRGETKLTTFVENPRRALWTLALPIMVGMSIQTIYSIVDMVFVGRISPEALTALAFNMPLLFLAMGMTFGLGSAVTALIAQTIGARDTEGGDAVGQHAVVLGLCLTACFTLAGLGLGPRLLAFIGVPETILPLAWDYFQVLAAGFLFMVMSVFFRSVLSGEGEVRVPVMIQAGGTLLNIVLDALFIFGFGWGVRGAALATIASQAVVATTFVWLIYVRRYSHVNLSLRGFRPDLAIIRRLVQIGAPASLSFLVMATGGGAFNRILVEYSPDAVAALQVGMRLDHLVILPMVSLSASLVTLVGMFYGARRFDLLDGIVHYALGRAIAIALVVAVAFFLFAPWLVAPFTDSGSIRSLAVQYLRTVAFAYPFFPISMLTGRFLQGLGRGTPELILSLMRVLLIAVPLATVCAFVLELPVVWIWRSMIAGSILTAMVAWFWMRAGLRRAQAECDAKDEIAASLGPAYGVAR